jgi:hypothetical protein
MRFSFLLALPAILLVQGAVAQTLPTPPTVPIPRGEILIPLDSRPATRTLPAKMAGLLGGTVFLPPSEMLGTAKRGADPVALTAWLAEQPKTGPLLVALDTLAYGGLVQSRSSRDSVATVMARLEGIRDWHTSSGQAVYAFVVLPRQPDAVDRARNLEVARNLLEWARQGVFAELHITWDDALPGSPAPLEGASLAQIAPPNVRVYSGADEVLGTLLARALAPNLTPLAVEYSLPQKADEVIKYEGIALSRSVALHAAAAGWQVLNTLPKPILTPFGGMGTLLEPNTSPSTPQITTLYVFNGGNPRAAALRISQLLRERGRVAVADVERINTANLRTWNDLYTLERPKDLASLAAWGTPGNNLGTVLAHAKIYTHVPVHVPAHIPLERNNTFDPIAAQDALLAHQYANDIVYSSHVRAKLRKRIPEAQIPSSDAAAVLFELAQPYFPLEFKANYSLERASLPWNRSFEAELILK